MKKFKCIFSNFIGVFLIIMTFSGCIVADELDGNDYNVVKDYTMKVVKGSNKPIIDKRHPGAFDNEYGFENGYVIKLDNGEYHMLITEMFTLGDVGGQSYWSPARIGHWVSKDGDKWTRVNTVLQGNAVHLDPKENTWSASWFWNEDEDRWNLFWRGAWTVFRYVSEVKGKEGIYGPYIEANVITPISGEQKWWECGIASFGNVYQALDGKYYAFYGNAYRGPQNEMFWYNGLAVADNAAGPWMKDASKTNPDFIYSENPFVYKYDGVYFAVFDELVSQHSIGYAYSHDGVNWVHKSLDLTGHTPWVANNWYVETVRTPFSFIREDDGTYTILFTGRCKDTHYYSIGKISVALEAGNAVEKDDTGLYFPGDMNKWKDNRGRWIVIADEYSQRNTASADYSSTIVDRTWTDLVAEIELRCVEKNGSEINNTGGIHFRKSNPDDKPGDSGYLAQISANGVIQLIRGSKILGQYTTNRPAYIFRKLRVEATGGNIKVYYGDSENPVINVDDSTYSNGYISINVSRSKWHYRSIKITPEPVHTSSEPEKP